jgi:hypothetical protein
MHQGHLTFERRPIELSRTAPVNIIFLTARPRPEPKPGRARPSSRALARASRNGSPSPPRPGPSPGFQAEPGPAKHYFHPQCWRVSAFLPSWPSTFLAG